MGSTTKNFLKKGVFFFLFLVSHLLYSQFYHGIEVGINMNNADFKVGESAEPSNALGFYFGYIAERELSDNLYVRLGINFNRRELKVINRRGINTSKEKWGIDAIEIPINLGYYVNWNNRNLQFFVDGGFTIGYNNRAINKNKEETIRLDIGGDTEIKRMAIGANAGIGVLIKKRIKARLNYYRSLSNIINTKENTWKNKTFGLSIYYFGSTIK